jgi:hypothetical protein
LRVTGPRAPKPAAPTPVKLLTRSPSRAALAVVGHPPDTLGDDVGQALGIVGMVGVVAVALPGHVGGDHPVALGQRLDVAHPVVPRAEAAVQQHHRVALAPDPPDHAAVAAGCPQGERAGFEIGEQGRRVAGLGHRWSETVGRKARNNTPHEARLSTRASMAVIVIMHNFRSIYSHYG